MYIVHLVKFEDLQYLLTDRQKERTELVQYSALIGSSHRRNIAISIICKVWIYSTPIYHSLGREQFFYLPMSLTTCHRDG